MTRKFKMAGVLMAVVAMFALTASAAQAQFTSEKYPAKGTATSTSDVFHAFGSTVKCTHGTFTGTLAAASSTLTITPTYTGCTAFGLPATVQMTSCKYVFHEDAEVKTEKETHVVDTVDVDCNTGDGIDINVYSTSGHTTAICHVKVPEQFGKTGYALANSGSGVSISGSVGGLTATQSRTNAVLCPPGTHTEVSAYTIQAGGIHVTGDNGVVSVD